MPAQAPSISRRPKFGHWLRDNRITQAQAGERLGKHPITVGRYCKEFGNPDRRVPDEDTLREIVAWTKGAVTAADFYPPELNGFSPCALAAERVREDVQ